MESITGVLKNGIRIVYVRSESPVSHCALMVGAGSREELPGKEGLAHFIEHLLFKGTEKRKAYQVLNRLEVVGGELNAFTTKEETCLHASYLTEHTERAIELLSDVFFHSVFPEKEMEKEKEVILDEINSYQDNPMEQIYDDFESMVFRGQPLGNPILGTPASVMGFKRVDLVRFVKGKYLNSSIVFSYAGNLSFDKVKSLCEKYFAEEGHQLRTERGKITRTLKQRKRVETRKTLQAHFITGGVAYSAHSAKRFPLFLMNNILGGPGMNSRLNMNIREKFGFTYQIDSSYIPFRDCGLFNVYLATEKKFLEKTIKLVEVEFNKLKQVKIGTAQLARYKYQMKGQLALSQENKAGVMINNAKSVLNYDKPIKISDVFAKLDAVTASQVLAVSNEILNTSRISSLLYNPIDH
ncbi:MAG: insulinase family protein [Bacteroidota bacterium]|nr:insulinase family protein [Bacteroidota bacterium]